MDENPLSKIISSITPLGESHAGSTFLALAAAGTIAMAIVQLVKEFTPARSSYQQYWFRGWILSRVSDCETIIREIAKDEELSGLLDTGGLYDVENDIVEMSTGGMTRALYNLPTEDMVAQMKLTIPVIIDEARQYPALLLLLSLKASPDDLKTVLCSQADTGSTNKYFNARTRIARRMERNLDGVQIALTDRWKFWMQTVSISITTVIIELAIVYNAIVYKSHLELEIFLLALPIGVVGGYFAPIARDLLAAVQKLRTP